MDLQQFYLGQAYDIYKYLGCYLTKEGAVFRVFAPSAASIDVTGEFNDWKETPMKRTYDGNFWECTISGVREGMII